jgi:hypothetical protein
VCIRRTPSLARLREPRISCDSVRWGGLGGGLKHWFLRWLVLKWAAPLAAVVGFFEAVAILYQVDDVLHAFLADHRPLTTFCLAASFLISLVAEAARVDRHRLIERRKDLLDDRPDQE